MSLMPANRSLLDRVTPASSAALLDPSFPASTGIDFSSPTAVTANSVPNFRFSSYPGESMSTAFYLGIVNGQTAYSEHVGGARPEDGTLDFADYTQFELTTASDLYLKATGLQGSDFTADVDLYLFWDANNNRVEDPGELIAYSETNGKFPEEIARSGLQAGSYYAVLVAYDARITNQARYADYRLTVTTGAANTAGSTPATARNLGLVTGDLRYSDYIGIPDPNDWYRFQLTGPSSVEIRLSQMTGDANVYLVQDANRNGFIDDLEILSSSIALGNTSELINPPGGLTAGDYYIWVRQGTATSSTNYTLSFSVKEIDVGETYSTAAEIGVLSGQKSLNGNTNLSNDPGDVYRFSLATSSDLRLELSELTGNTDLYLVRDLNGNNIVDSNDVIALSVQLGLNRETISRANLDAGTYFAYVTPGAGSSGTINYTLTLTADGAGSTYTTARNIGIPGSTPSSFVDFVGDLDLIDSYRFQVNTFSNVTINLEELTANANLFLLQDLNGNGQFDSGEIILSSINTGNLSETIRTRLNPGIYYAYVNQFSGNTNYRLSVSVTPLVTQTLSGTLAANVFTPNLNVDRTIISGNGNVEFGNGRYDILDLSWVSSNALQGFNLVNANSGGVAYNPGNGTRLFDQITLATGQEILFEGIDRIQFSDRPILLSVTPNDPLFNLQWNLQMMGVHNAWRFTQGTSNILIGIEDSGLGINSTGTIHPDLRTTSVSGTNYIDEFYDESVGPERTSHGTAVQSIIAATTNNNRGMSGINWNSQIYHIDVIGGNVGDLALGEATRRLLNSATGKRLIVNMSLSGRDPDPNAFEQLVAQNPNVLFVIASGNDNRSSLDYPASLAQRYGNVMAVGAVFKDGSRMLSGPNDGSNYGNGLSLVGPTRVLAASAAPTSLRSDVTFDYEGSFGGTSAATPNVTGVASLVWSANPNLSAVQVNQILQQTASDLGTSGYDIFYGAGLVNADAAVRRALALARSAA